MRLKLKKKINIFNTMNSKLQTISSLDDLFHDIKNAITFIYIANAVYR